MEIYDSDYEQARILRLLVDLPGQSQTVRSLTTATSPRNPDSCVMINTTLPVVHGGQSNIYQGRLAGRLVAIKRPRVYDKMGNNIIRNEFLIMSLIRNHPHILDIVGVTYQGGIMSIITPWMKKGSLAEFVQSGKCVEIKQKLTLAKQVIGAVAFMKKLSIVHGDLKAANILIRDNGAACIADFGLSRLVDAVQGTSVTATRGSLRWMSPELLLSDVSEVTYESDIYAYAMVVYELHTGRIPYFNSSDFATFSQIINGQSTPRLGIADNIWHLMQECWNSNPNLRPTPERVIEYLDAMEGT